MYMMSFPLLYMIMLLRLYLNIRLFMIFSQSYMFKKSFSYDQLLEGLEFMGEEYEKLVEILTVATDDNFILDSNRSYFDRSNYYFEIYKESTLKKRGPFKKIEGTLLWEWAFF